MRKNRLKFEISGSKLRSFVHPVTPSFLTFPFFGLGINSDFCLLVCLSVCLSVSLFVRLSAQQLLLTRLSDLNLRCQLLSFIFLICLGFKVCHSVCVSVSVFPYLSFQKSVSVSSEAGMSFISSIIGQFLFPIHRPRPF